MIRIIAVTLVFAVAGCATQQPAEYEAATEADQRIAAMIVSFPQAPVSNEAVVQLIFDLEEFVMTDLPFAISERAGVIRTLQDAVSESMQGDTSAAARSRPSADHILSMVRDAYLDEQALGSVIGSGQAINEQAFGPIIDNGQANDDVYAESSLLRVTHYGRLALVAESPDGKQFACFDLADSRWIPAPAEQAVELARNMRAGLSRDNVPSGWPCAVGSNQ